MDENNQNSQPVQPNNQKVIAEKSTYPEGEKVHLTGSLENMDPNVAAALSYIVPPFTGILIFLLEKDHRFVKFHSFQSILFGFVSWGALSITDSLIVVGNFLNTVVRILSILLWLFLMWKAYNKEEFELPMLGKIAKDQTIK